MKSLKRFLLSALIVAALGFAPLPPLAAPAFATVESTTNLKRAHGNASTTAFAFTFKVLQSSDLKVYTVNTTTNLKTLKVEGADYTVTLLADNNGGTVTFLAAPAASVDVLLVGDPAATQPADFPAGGPLSETALEGAMDRAALVNTSQGEQINRSLKLKIEDPLNVSGYGGLYIKAEAARDNKILKWSTDGTQIDTGIDADTLSDAADAAAASQTAAAASAASASSSASASSASAASASSSATTAATAAASFKGTSTSAVAVGTGTKTFTTQAGKLWAVGDQVIAASAADPTKYVHGPVTAYSGTTLTLNSTDAGAAGTPSDWNISLSGTIGPAGATGATGATGASGAGTGDMLAAQNLNDVSNKATARVNLGVAIGTNVQAFDATLTSIAALGTAANKMLYTTGVDTWAEQAITSAGRTLVAAADAAAERTALGLGTAAVATTGTSAGNVVVLDGSAKLPAVDGSALTNLPSSTSQFMIVREEKSTGASGGTFTSGSWTARILNTTVTNTITSASLASNQITLPAGSYEIDAVAPAFFVYNHQARLYNVTDSADTLLGTLEYTAAVTGNSSHIHGVFTIGGSKVFEIQHRCGITRATDGYGDASQSGTFGESAVYTSVFIRKL